MKPFRLSKPYLLSQKRALIVYVLIILASSAITILSPYIIGDFLDTLIEGADIGVIMRFSAVFGGLSLIKIVKGYVTSVLYVKMRTKMVYGLNMDVIKHVQGLSLSYINSKDSAYLNQRVNSDAYGLITFCITVLQSIITNVVLLVVPFIVLLSMNRLIAVLMMVFIVVYAASYFAFKKPLYRAGLAFRETQAKFFSKLFEQFKYLKLIKINSIQSEMNRRADDSFEDFKGTAVHNQKVNYLYSGMDGFISTLAQIALFIIGGIQVLAGNFTIGMFTIFTAYFNMMLGASRYFFGLGASYQNTLVSYDRIQEIFDQKQEGCGTEVLTDINKISLRNLGFSYALQESEDKLKPAAKKVIDSLNTEFCKGKIYVITGVNGAGKSTLISLLMGMYIDEYSGEISYDGKDIRSLDIVTTRKNLLGFAEQEPMLLQESILYNLCFDDAVDAEYASQTLAGHINTLNMQGFVSENSLNFPINEKNTNTSGGEKQKISILKVMYKDPAVMIFDEPTSALDTGTTDRFMAYLQEIKKDKIIIVITHDMFVQEQCDKVVQL